MSLWAPFGHAWGHFGQPTAELRPMMDVSDLVGRQVYLMIVDNDDDTLKKGGFAWIGLNAVYQLE